MMVGSQVDPLSRFLSHRLDFSARDFFHLELCGLIAFVVCLKS